MECAKHFNLVMCLLTLMWILLYPEVMYINKILQITLFTSHISVTSRCGVMKIIVCFCVTRSIRICDVVIYQSHNLLEWVTDSNVTASHESNITTNRQASLSSNTEIKCHTQTRHKSVTRINKHHKQPRNVIKKCLIEELSNIIGINKKF